MAFDFEFFVTAPGGLYNGRLAIAASQGGGYGIVDLEFEPDVTAGSARLQDLARATTHPIGVRIDPVTGADWLKRAPALPGTIGTIILGPGLTGRELKASVKALKAAGKRVLAEIVDRDALPETVKAGVDGIIAKGNEAGGRVADQSAYILSQHLLRQDALPVYVQGGIGMHTAGACGAVGAAGVVLDWQFARVQESRLNRQTRGRIAPLDSSRCFCVGRSLGLAYRLAALPGSTLPAGLEALELELQTAPAATSRKRWIAAIHAAVTADPPQAWPIGQEIDITRALGAQATGSAAGLLAALKQSVVQHMQMAKTTTPLAEGRGSAEVLGTRFPVIQGPMSRVSDTAAFAGSVADAGGLPMIAASMIDPEELDPILTETAARAGERPWGVGLLGFIDPAFYARQLEIVKRTKPPIALVAGGNPSHLRELESEGIRTYLHTPSPSLLRSCLDEGARNFVFEGRECGGHVGRLYSFPLWDMVVRALLERIAPGEGGQYDIWFAGGISDERSAAMVAALAAPLVARGVHVGVVAGTAYLLTQEAVEHGAITAAYQQRLLDSRTTDVMECGGGYDVRTAPCPFTDTFAEEKRRLKKTDLPPEEIKMKLEHMNLGRLRIAAKALKFNLDYLEDQSVSMTVEVPASEQSREGVFMAGDSITLHDQAMTAIDLHERMTTGCTSLIAATPLPANLRERVATVEPGADIAIIGMSCAFAKAPDIQTYWENILGSVIGITEVPADRWDWRLFFDEDEDSRDHIYARWGGFIDPVAFNPMSYGIPPTSLASIDPMQLLSLEYVRQALADAGYSNRPFDRENTSVMLGVAGGMGETGLLYAMRSTLPLYIKGLPEELMGQLPEWTSNSFPGILPNVAAGRVANTFDFGGTNCTLDAACASSLAAVYMGYTELARGNSNMVVVGGIDVMQNPFGFLCFSKTKALSRKGESRPFDAARDGIVIGEGIGMVVMKRLADAERDGDRIYAVLRGVGSSSDGKGRSLTAPSSEGQIRALGRAYGQADLPLASVELVEAHGTGTPLGDATEANTLKSAFEQVGAPARRCAVGSVKSMIGHTKGCAGIAGLIKTALALHHRVLPPTTAVDDPTPKECWDEQSPTYINSEPRPWIGHGVPRRAGVSAFGFGGTNFHAVLEEYGDGRTTTKMPLNTWPCELFCWSAASADDLVAAATATLNALGESNAQLRDLSAHLTRHALALGKAKALRLAIVASGIDELRSKLTSAIEQLGKAPARIRDPRGIYFSARPLAHAGQVAFLFPGQGSQRVDMQRDLALLFPELREAFATADRVLGDRLGKPLSDFVYPPPSFSAEEAQRRMAELTATNVAQPALGAADLGMFKLLEMLNVRPDMTAGHSTGEYIALAAAGVYDEETLYALLEQRGDSIVKGCTGDMGTMMAIKASLAEIEADLEDFSDVYPANFNSPTQTILSGLKQDLEPARERLESRGFTCRYISVSCGFHSPLMAPAQGRLSTSLEQLSFLAPRLPVYSNYLAEPYPAEQAAIRDILSDHLIKPVRFTEEITAMYEAGARIFIEVGPGNVGRNLAAQILGDREYAAIATNTKGAAHDLQPLLMAIAELAAEGVDLDPEILFDRRTVATLDRALCKPAADSTGKPGMYLLAPDRVWPANQPRPQITPVSFQAGAAVAPAGRVFSPAAAGTPAMPMGTPAPLPTGLGSDIFARHQQLMSAFLQQQRDVMMAFLGQIPAAPGALPPAAPALSALTAAPAITLPVAAPAPAMSPPVAPAPPAPAVAVSASAPTTLTEASLIATLLGLVAEQTGYPLEMLDLDLNLEADLGIDSIKRVEILNAYARRLPNAPKGVADKLSTATTLREVAQATLPLAGVSAAPAPAPAATAATAAVPLQPATGVSEAGLTEALVALVAEQTGYPREMLDLDLNIEADLGIDSIKRVEILNAFASALPGRPQGMADSLSSASTLRVIVEAALTLMGGESASPAPAPADADTGPMPDAGAALLLGAVELSQQLVALVAEHTGYPPEMLDLDLNIEADLGIDSIKRVEILNAFAKALPGSPQGLADKVNTARTLSEVANATAAVLAGSDLAGETADVKKKAKSPGGMKRLVARLRCRPVPDDVTVRIPEGVVLIVDDDHGHAKALKKLIEAHGGNAVRLGGKHPDYDADITRPDTIQELLARIRADHGRIGGLVHLAALSSAPDLADCSAEVWETRLREEVISCFLLLHFASADLNDEPSAWIAACAHLGAQTPSEGALPLPDYPWRGAVLGLLKSAAAEYGDAVCRAIGVGKVAANVLARHITEEMSLTSAVREVYFSGNQRFELEYVNAPLTAEASSVELGSEDVILAIGGARGITSMTVLELARRHGGRFVLAGRSAWPDGESAATAAVTDRAELKRILFETQKQVGGKVSPKEIERACQRILNDREMRENRAALEAAGATEVIYLQANIQNPESLADLLKTVRERYGRLDGIINGAGVIEDKLLADKSPESFERVLWCKALPAYFLASRLDLDGLKFVALFSSIAGAYGSRGQGDYAAANEVFNRTAQFLTPKGNARVVALNWGPWDKAGMVTDAVRRQFEERGVGIIAPAPGSAFMADEIARGDHAEAIVVAEAEVGYAN